MKAKEFDLLVVMTEWHTDVQVLGNIDVLVAWELSPLVENLFTSFSDMRLHVILDFLSRPTALEMSLKWRGIEQILLFFIDSEYNLLAFTVSVVVKRLSDRYF